MRILAIHPGALGDILLSLPALHTLKRKLDRSILTLAGNPEYLSVASGQLADRIISLEALPLHRLHSGSPLPVGDIALWHSYHRIISWTGAASAEYRRSLSEIHPNVLVASWRPSAGETRHVSRIFLESLRPWLEPLDEEIIPAVRLAPPDPDSGRAWLSQAGWNERSRLVAIHAGAGGSEKRWGIDRYAAVGRILLGSPEILLLVIEGPAESGIGKELAGRLDSNRVIAAVDMPLDLLASALPFARAFLGNDSGIAHLAAGLGVSSLVLFGPTSPELWAPLGAQVSILVSGRRCMDEIAVQEVLDRVLSILST